MTLILGKSMSTFYIFFGNNLSWYGVFLLILNLIIGLTILQIGLQSRNKINIGISIIVVILITPFNILTPTYTVSSILSCGVGIIGLLKKIGTNFSKYEILLYSLLIYLGFLIRPEALYGSFAFLLPIFFLKAIYNFKSFLDSKLYQYILGLAGIILISNLIQNLMFNYFVKSNELIGEYLNFQSIRHQLFYTPAILKLHQSVISGDILSGIWSNVDFILLRNWSYADLTVFSYKNLLVGRDHVSQFIGIEGFLNSDFKSNSQEVLSSLREVFPILTLLGIIFLLVVSSSRLRPSAYLGIALVLGSYFFAFNYATAVLRLPFRVTFPYLSLLILLLIIYKSYRLRLPNIFGLISSKILVVLIVVQILYIQVGTNFGVVGIINSNITKLDSAKLRDVELLSKVEDGIFIGPISYFPINTQGAYFSNLNWSSGKQTLALDWSTYSPTWRQTARNLKIDSITPYNSVARQKNVYWVSNSYLAEILNMYMNDHKIYRGKLCSVAKLSGTDQAEIFTFQAKETDC